MKIIKALQYASEKHKNQVRRSSGIPYVTHPIIVSEFVRLYKNSKEIEDLVCASILHDVIEDTTGTYDEILENFGVLVASLVQELTSNPEGIKIHGKNKYLIQKMSNMSSWALVIKLADRLSNILDNPTTKYTTDTSIMMTELKNNRTLSKTHYSIIAEIEKILSRL